MHVHMVLETHSIFGRPVLSFDSTGRALPLSGAAGPSRSTESAPPRPILGRFMEVYCDDILFFSKTREEHLVHVRIWCTCTSSWKRCCTTSSTPRPPSASSTAARSDSSATSDPRKVAAVADWATLQSCTDLRRIVGLANYYRKFVLRFSALAAPRTALCSLRARFKWSDVEQRSFDALKRALTSAPVLRVWDPELPTRLLTDASELAVSAILEQPDDEGVFHPVAFESHKLTLPERSYPPHLLELLAVVHALKALRPYLLDPSSCTLTTRVFSGYSSSATSATTRLVGSTCLPSSSTASSTSRAGPTPPTS